uniref:HD domain-containing protein n=1 Tax=Zooxanthella nutricula TaxID=1333877 RepID=A0A6V0I2Z4_9DINO
MSRRALAGLWHFARTPQRAGWHKREALLGQKMPHEPRRFQTVAQTPIDRNVKQILGLLQSAPGKSQLAREPTAPRSLGRVSPLTRGLRAAEEASEQGFGDELVLAALLHDCGQLLGAGDPHTASLPPEERASKWLRAKGMSTQVCSLVFRDVDTRRYIWHMDPGLFQSLPDSAKADLTAKGGPMAADEAAAFEQLRLFGASMALRRCCEVADMAAEDPRPPGGIAQYRCLLEEHLGEQLAEQCWWETLGESGTYHLKR